MKTKKATKPSEITDEDIEKAFDELEEEAIEISKSVEDEEEVDDEDAEEVDEEELDDDEEEDDEEEEIEKSKDEDDEDEDDEDEDDEDEDKKKPAKKKDKKKFPFKKAVSEDFSKAIEVSPFLKGIADEVSSTNLETRKVLSNVATLLKGVMEELGELKDSFSGEPRQRKSRISKSQVSNRFGSEEESEEAESGIKTVGLRSGYSTIVKALDELAFGSGTEEEFKPDFGKAIRSFESRKVLPQSVVDTLLKEKKIKVDPSK